MVDHGKAPASTCRSWGTGVGAVQGTEFVEIGKLPALLPRLTDEEEIQILGREEVIQGKRFVGDGTGI